MLSLRRTHLLLALCASPILAQGVSVQLGGTITSQGQAVADATVVIRNLETGYTRTLRSDAQGRYLAATIPVGTYSVTITKSGYQTATAPKVVLNLGEAAPLNFQLVNEASQTVVVTAALAPVDSDRASAASFVSPDNLTNLPVFNRSFTNLATLTPQVQVDSQRGNLAIAGQRGVNTSINIDGGDVNEPFFGGATGAAEGKTPFTVSIEAIREYQVITDGASAEFGRMGGGYVNAVTKSGSNDLSGSVFYYQRPQSLVARQPNLNGIPDSNKVGDFKQQQFGFSLGGPILKDKLFYFVAYDGQRRTDSINFNWGGNSPVTLDPVANPNDGALLSRAGGYDSKSNSDVIFLRFDWIINTDQTLQLRINHSDFKGDVGSGITASSENVASDNVKTDSGVLQWTWTITPSLLNEARLNYVTDNLPRVARTSNPQVSISNVGFYGAYPFERQFETKRIQLSENLTYFTPTIQLKGGIDYNKLNVSEVFASFYRGGYSFKNLTDFRAGNWASYTQRLGLGGLSSLEAGKFDAEEKEFAAYVQADWRPIDSLKLGFGLRWDRQQHPDFPIADYSNPLSTSMPLTQRIPNDSQFSPRFSFTWTPAFDQGKTVMRGSLGRYVSTTPSVFLYQAYTLNGQRAVSYTINAFNSNGTTNAANVAAAAAAGIGRGAGFNPNSPATFTSTPTAGAGATDLWTFSPNFKNPYTDRANLGVERAMYDFVFGISGTYAKGKQLERATDINLNSLGAANAQGRQSFLSPRPNTAYRQLAMYVSDAESLYHAYTFSMKYHKDGSDFDGQLFYTYAINKDNDSNERNFSSYSTANTRNLGADWSYADSDRRHTLTGYVSYLERRWSGIQSSLAFRYVSGFPYSLTISGDRNNDGVSGNDRMYIGGVDSGRNTQRSASNTTIDLGLRRDFLFPHAMKLTLSADVFNLLNRHDTYDFFFPIKDPSLPSTAPNNDSTTVLSSRRAVVGSARQVQLGVRFAF
jgi:hypothetical protein